MRLNWSSSFDVTTYTEVPCHSMYWVWKIHPCMLKAVSTEPGFCSPLPAIVTKNIYNQSTKWDQRQIQDWSSRRLPPVWKKWGFVFWNFWLHHACNVWNIYIFLYSHYQEIIGYIICEGETKQYPDPKVLPRRDSSPVLQFLESPLKLKTTKYKVQCHSGCYTINIPPALVSYRYEA